MNLLGTWHPIVLEKTKFELRAKVRDLKKGDVEESTGSMDGTMEKPVKDTQTAKSTRRNTNSEKKLLNKVVSSLRQKTSTTVTMLMNELLLQITEWTRIRTSACLQSRSWYSYRSCWSLIGTEGARTVKIPDFPSPRG